VAICCFIGTIEVLGLVPQELHWNGGFWTFMENFDINKAGFVIVGTFLLTWC
jgi:nickel/cobalt transporter (NiCoT) family protein